MKTDFRKNESSEFCCIKTEGLKLLQVICLLIMKSHVTVTLLLLPTLISAQIAGAPFDCRRFNSQYCCSSRIRESCPQLCKNSPCNRPKPFVANFLTQLPPMSQAAGFGLPFPNPDAPEQPPPALWGQPPPPRPSQGPHDGHSRPSGLNRHLSRQPDPQPPPGLVLPPAGSPLSVGAPEVDHVNQQSQNWQKPHTGENGPSGPSIHASSGGFGHSLENKPNGAGFGQMVPVEVTASPIQTGFPTLINQNFETTVIPQFGPVSHGGSWAEETGATGTDVGKPSPIEAQVDSSGTISTKIGSNGQTVPQNGHSAPSPTGAQTGEAALNGPTGPTNPTSWPSHTAMPPSAVPTSEWTSQELTPWNNGAKVEGQDQKSSERRDSSSKPGSTNKNSGVIVPPSGTEELVQLGEDAEVQTIEKLATSNHFGSIQDGIAQSILVGASRPEHVTSAPHARTTRPEPDGHVPWSFKIKPSSVQTFSERDLPLPEDKDEFVDLTERKSTPKPSGLVAKNNSISPGGGGLFSEGRIRPRKGPKAITTRPINSTERSGQTSHFLTGHSTVDSLGHTVGSFGHNGGSGGHTVGSLGHTVTNHTVPTTTLATVLHGHMGQCGTAPDFKPCVGLAEANSRLQACCRAKKMPDGCLPLCRFDTTQQEIKRQFDAGKCGILNVAPFLECASQQQDNRECCRANNLAAKSGPQCEVFCHPRDGLGSLGLQHLACQSVISDLLKCHHAGIKA
ncbi:unnamed protein product [Bursaphelenchus okinawaensis]|uniref:Domain of unknown function DB domain-containing protein n=1 Tax=Bursaphelenchus okinawaensis TaxID=465554 RepID=A0A811LI22_9BILA|nr:unnamed protein product [Bursaphelenchus okinawaensis]CAG9123634.1 unnamed protein product [Bursaphelenchus okinawaensis]